MKAYVFLSGKIFCIIDEELWIALCEIGNMIWENGRLLPNLLLIS